MADPDKQALPMPDFDHLPLATLQHRIRSLDLDQLQRVADYERAHGNRAPVLTVVDARLRELRGGAEPSGGAPDAATPEAAPAPAGDTGISPQTAGPKQNPPSQGVPSNPAQPRPTG
jgi:hypothetical protein